MRFWGPKGIERFVAAFLRRNASALLGRRVVDIPAGDGRSSAILAEVGATPLPLDLFPEFFKVPGLECQRADLSATLPLPDGTADVLLCQEGLEHVPDQLRALREFARVLAPGGTLLVTCPNASSLRSRLSYLLAESELMGHYMPPNEHDSVWSPPERREEQYLGHVFLIGLQRLRLLAHLAGFRIRRVNHSRANLTSLALVPLCYPAVVVANLIAYWRSLRRAPAAERAARREVYREQLRLGLDPRTLVDCHLFVEFERVA